ncbi:MAG: capsule assembly Wzi family protein [Candidatus Acidiferrum sp.]
MMRGYLIVLAFSWAASSLTLTSPVSRPATPQGQEESERNAKPNSSAKEAKEKDTKKKTADAPDPDFTTSPPRGVKALAKEFLLDQEQIWTSPAKIRLSDTQWLLPLSGITAGLFVTDTDYSSRLSKTPSTLSRYTNLSDAGIGALVGGAGGMWLLGHVKHNEHWSETGFLAGEAALNSLVAVESLKYSLGRERPFQGDGTGPFFQGGTSFPSEHAALAWSVAGVVAHEYPGPLMKIMAYGLASLVDYSRIRSRQHFPSDVFVGSMMGNFIGQNIYTRNHDPGLGGEAWKSVNQIFRNNGNLTSSNMGSTYVPMDSWVYSAFDRLAAMGFVRSGMSGMRPWTRLECARLLNEAENHNIEDSGSSEAARTYAQLVNEFAGEFREMGAGENRSARVESIYERVTGIAGQPLTDGFNFGQTIINDYGRPYQEGLNSADGFSAWASEGHLVAYVRAEYEHSPSAPAVSESARAFISSSNSLPSIAPATPVSAVNRFQLLDSYVGLNFSNWQITFGPQTLWWGPSLGGPLMFSDNATPVNMLRINRVSPFKLPSFLGWLGPWRLESFLGQLTEHDFVFQTNTGLLGQFGQSLARQPFLDGSRISFKPLPDFELGLSLTVVFAGGPTPLTAHTFIHSYSPSQGSNGVQGGPGDPGDRRSGLDFTFRIPGLTDGLSFYSEAFVEDEYSPIAYWRNAATWSGLYLAQVPKFNKLDFRVEAGYTDLPSGLQNGTPTSHYAPGIFYSNDRYPNGSYTNNGNLLGNWMGRQSQGVQAWSNYRFSPRSFIQASFRHQKVSHQFMPDGGSLTDATLSANVWLRNDLSISGSVQYERWLYPVITAGAQTNLTTSLQLVFWPQSWRK